MSLIDWPGLLKVGLFRLRLRPAEFWALTPVELLLMMGPSQHTAPIDRSTLSELSRRYPDMKGESDG